MKFINVRELKSRTSEMLRIAAGERIVVTSRGKPVAFIQGVADSEFELPGQRPVAPGIRESAVPYGSIVGGGLSVGPASGQMTRAEYEMKKNWNPLKAVFWDYPELTDETVLGTKIKEARDSALQDAFRWYLARFLERGRIADTLRFFRPEEIRRSISSLKISSRALAKWAEIIEFNGRA
jgi:prevent-host-death family protein